MTGAEAVLRTGEAGGVEYCFTNPGSTEMELLVAFDVVTGVRPVLGLHETVCTGMADGYGRIAERPAFTLLHQGSGLSNGSANLHNAKKAPSPIVNLVGTNATRTHDRTPLASDIAALAGPVSDWCRTARSAETVARDTADAIAAASSAPGRVATLILPSEAQSGECSGPAPRPTVDAPRIAGADAITRVAALLRDTRDGAALVLHSRALTARALAAAGRIATTTGCALLTESIPRSWVRGADHPLVQFVPCLSPPAALAALGKYRQLVYVGARLHEPYFLLADTPSPLVPAGAETTMLASAADDLEGTLEALADSVGAGARGVVQLLERPAIPTGPLTATAINAIVGALLPEHAIVVQTSTTGARDFLPLTRGAPSHTLLMNTGASIGWGMPAAAGAALAARGRRVIHLAADGGDVLSVQALWTQAREKLDVTTIVFCNRMYKILANEITRLTPAPGPRAASLLSLDNPTLDYSAIAVGFGVPASRATTAEELVHHLKRALAEPGPHLIEAVL